MQSPPNPSARHRRASRLALWAESCLAGSAVGLSPAGAALFSLPFWIVGLAMGADILNALLRRETIELKADELVVRRQQPLVPTVVTIPYADIRSISVEPVAPRSPMEAASLVASSARSISRSAEHPRVFRVPTISHGTRKTRFVLGVSEAEMKWLVAFLRAIVGAKTGRRF